MNPTKSRLLVPPDFSQPQYMTITPEIAGWEHLTFGAVQLEQGKEWFFSTSENELVIAILGGTCDVITNFETFKHVGSRSDVFHGLPTALYFSRNTSVSIRSISENLDFAFGFAKAKTDYPNRLIKPEDISIELRGGDNASRQINKMVPPGFSCDRLVMVEVYTPSGNWSSYPPHKHDKRILDKNGELLEADLEEIYFYKINKPEGFAYQRIYNDNRTLDELILVSDNHLVLSPEGYHPVVSGFGYDSYYLNILAGSDQSLASTDDPAYSWVKQTWKTIDPRLPLVTIEMNRLGD
jgi:5-deoxy-glucuronate isomerase